MGVSTRDAFVPRARDLYRFVREERVFCGMLAHLLMQRGSNLAAFLELINARLPEHSRLATMALDEAQVYVEFTLLRDHWNALGRDNDRKRELILTLLSRIDRLKGYHCEELRATAPELNEYFMGRRGRNIKDDISYPGQWSVRVLKERFGADPDLFRAFCLFKWAFNIKPDLVVLPPVGRPICVECKLESREGQYPADPEECGDFDKVCGRGKGRASQIEVQRFMFRDLLGDPCQLVTIGWKRRHEGEDVVSLSWGDVFARLDLSCSVGFVRKLIEKNEHLKARAANTDRSPSAMRR